MADKAMSGMDELAVEPASGDLFEVTNISEAAAADKNQKITWKTLKKSLIIAQTFAISGNGFAITTGAKSYKGHIKAPFSKCNIVRVDMESDVSTTTVIDLWHCTQAEYDMSAHPVNGDSITASAPPTITTALKVTNSTLTGWTKTGFVTGDIFGINVDSNDNCKLLIVTVYFQWTI